MSLNPAMWALTLTELGLWITLCCLFWKKRLQHRFPAMTAYVTLRAVATPVLMALLYFMGRPDSELAAATYFYLYWTVYLVCSVLLFVIATEVFRAALTGFSGLQRFGTVIFRWIAVASVIITVSTVSFSTRDWSIIPDIAIRLMRSVSIIELCLLAFLCLSMNALRLSARDLGFGIALGLGIFSTSDFVQGAFESWHGTMNDSAQFIAAAVALLALGVWSAYIAMPEPARKPVVVSANSTIYRWNEIASALGHKGTHVAVQQPANSFFLTDVEKVVEKVLTRTMQESETNS